jgi:hypothetical protein
MQTQISFLIPHSFEYDDVASIPSDDIFENKGTFEEILLLGQHLPVGAHLSQSRKNSVMMCLELVHLHATRDHIVLMDPKLLTIHADEELALRTSVMETIHHFLGVEGEFFNHFWVFPAGEFADLITHSPSQAMGLNVDIWMPKDHLIQGLAKKWRQLQNEIQMIWHDHPINQARLARGELPVNSVWMYGVGSAQQIQAHPHLKQVTHIFSDHHLGKKLDPRIEPLFGQLHIPSVGEHHFIFGQDLSPAKWHALWGAAVSALQAKKIDTIAGIDWQKNKWVKFTLSSSDVKPHFLKKFFKQKEPVHPFSNWSNYSQKIHWQTIE